MRDRFFIDERVGCIAVIDRQHPDYDPKRQGLEERMGGVVWYEDGIQVVENCPHCGGTQGKGWLLRKGARERAEKQLRILNGE